MNIRNWLSIGVLSMALIASLLMGCGADEPATPAPEAFERAAEEAGGAAGEELLSNTSFEDDREPWYISRWGEGNEDLKPMRINDPEQGANVEFPLPNAGGISLVYNLYNLDESLRGRELVLHASGVSAAEGELALQMRYEINGESKRIDSAHPGDGEWREWETGVQIPEDGHPTHIRVQAFRRHVDNPSEIPVQLGSASLQVK